MNKTNKLEADFNFVDNARQRIRMRVFIDQVKNIGLFLFVAAVLIWLVLGVL